ncbi:hypothetical protein CNR22_11020 [Sphingobacteriaceae bacterium]|nr:hypothetical protein CNR22_11020 [Sphingobacteriaceae bacterium]
MRVTIFFLILFCRLSSTAQIPPPYTVTICNEKSEGYYFLTPAIRGTIGTQSISFNIILDEKGDLFYFKKFTGDSKPVDFKLLPNGLISYHSNGKFYFMNKSLSVVDSISVTRSFNSDHHELKLTKNGHYLLLAMESETVDIRPYQLLKSGFFSAPTTTITFGVIQEFDAAKNLVFEWRSKKHFRVTDIDTFYIKDPTKIDITHCNAIEEDWDGNLLLSSKNFSEITKINRKDGSIMWRLGGKNNQFDFRNDSLKFCGQHHIVRLPNGNISLFDNGKQGQKIHPATAKEYSLDEKNFTATLAWSYINDSTAHSSMGMGSVQRLDNGGTLVNYGNSNKSKTLFTVLTPHGEKCLELYFNDNRRSYRVFNYKNPALQVQRPKIKYFQKNGQLFLDAGRGYSSYLWSNGATTRIIPYKDGDSLFVCVAANQGGYLVSRPFSTKDLQNLEIKKRPN